MNSHEDEDEDEEKKFIKILNETYSIYFTPLKI